MAKLSAHGTEYARFEKKTINQPTEYTEWSRYEYAIMSDGWILKKLTVRFRADGISRAYTHSYGWKRARKIKSNKILDAVDYFINQGFKKVK